MIVPTRNSGATIARCLRSLMGLVHPAQEIIVVDSHSADGTGKIATGMGAKLVLSDCGRSDARAIGVQRSEGDYVLFLDADQEVFGDTLKECLRACVESGVEAVKIPEVFVGESFWGSCSALWKNSVFEAGGRGGGVPRFYRRRLLLEGAMPKKDLIFWEDQDLYERLAKQGMKTTWCGGVIIHKEAGDLMNIARKYFQYGASSRALPQSAISGNLRRTLILTLRTLGVLLQGARKPIRVYVGAYIVTAIKALSFWSGLLSSGYEPRSP